MRYYRCTPDAGPRLVVRTGDGTYDLTSVHDDLRTVSELLSAARLSGQSLAAITETLIEDAETLAFDDCGDDLVLPLQPAEVWAAGVTYEISEKAREEESTLPDVYQDVYTADRPELFFKSTPNRLVGPADHVGVREDSSWNVPEPELGVVIYQDEIVGYTIGNDVSSREIEGENPLYLPQAKVYDRSCSIGPCFVPAGEVADPHDLEMSMQIHRDGGVVWEGSTSTAQMVRTCEELVAFYRRSNDLPPLSVLLTGTSLVPEEGTTLKAGDTVRIEIESIGVLENPVMTV